MKVIEKEVFAFSLLNDLLDRHPFMRSHIYGILSKQIWAASTHQKMDCIIRLLKGMAFTFAQSNIKV